MLIPVILGPNGNSVDLAPLLLSACRWTRIDVARAAAWNPRPHALHVMATKQLILDPDPEVRRETAVGLWRICERLRSAELDAVLTSAVDALDREPDEEVGRAIAASLRRTRVQVPDAERILDSTWASVGSIHVPARRPPGYWNVKYARKDGVVGVKCPLRVGRSEVVFLHSHGRIHGLAASELVGELGTGFAANLDRDTPNEGIASSSDSDPDTLYAIECALGLPDVRAAVARIRKDK